MTSIYLKFINKFKKISLSLATVYLAVAFFVPLVHAADIEAILDDNLGASSFVVKGSDSITVAGIDSDGNIISKGCFRLGAAGTECTDVGNIIADGRIGIGVGGVAPAYELDVTGAMRATTEIRMGTGAGTLLGADNVIRPTVASGYLNLLGGAGNARISIGDTTVHIASGDGTQKLMVDALGNLGIGSTAPGAKLDVSGGAVRVLTGASAPGVDKAIGAGSLYIQDVLEVDGNVYLGDAIADRLTVIGTFNLAGDTAYSGPLTINTNNAGALLVGTGAGVDVLRVNTLTAAVAVSGNVGIGDTTPAAGLVVGSDAAASQANAATDAYIQRNLEVDGAVYGVNLYASGSLDVINNVTIGGALNVIGNIVAPITLTGDLEMGNIPFSMDGGTNGLAFDSNNDNINEVVIDATGNVGIGTTVPRAGLVIGSDATSSQANARTDVYIERNLEVDGAAYLAVSTSGNIQSSANAIAATNDSGITISDNAANGITLEDGGNVGIGSTAPRGRLNVQGGDVIIGNGTIDHTSSADDLYVTGNLEVDGNVYLGDAVTDSLTVMGRISLAGDTNYTGPITITTTHPRALLVEKADGTDVFNFDTSGNLLTLTGNYTVSGTGTVGNLAASANTIAATNDSGILLHDNAGNGLTVADGGFVGIGTTVPVAGLVVGSDAGAVLANAGTDAYIQRYLEVGNTGKIGNVQTSANTIAATNDSGILLHDNAGNGLTVADGGNVGIGTTVPRAGLVVGSDTSILQANSSIDAYIQRNLEVDGDIYGTDAFWTGDLQILGSTTVGGNLLVGGTLNAAVALSGDLEMGNIPYSIDGGTNGLAFDSNNDNTNEVVIDMMGNVGIGTTAPKAGLVVGNDAAATLANASIDAYIQGDLEVDGAAAITSGTIGNVQTTGNAISATNDAGLTLYDNASNGITILDGGSVGIGSVTPGSRLDVSGGIVRVLSAASAPSIDHAVGAGSLYVQTNLEVDGNVYLGDAVTDSLTVMGRINLAGDTNYTGPITITTTHPNALLVEKANGTDVFNFDTDGNLLTLTGNYTVSGTGTVGNLATSANTIAATNDSGILLRDNAGNGLTVADGGNVGIGDATPLAGLVVGSDAGASLANAAIDAYIQGDFEVDGIGAIGNVQVNANAIAATNDSGLTLYDNASNGITILDGGNIGVGSVTPGSRLDVFGGSVRILSGTSAPSVDHAAGAGSLYIQTNLEVDGNVYLGDAVADTLTVSGSLNLAGNTNYTGPVTITTTDANALLIEKTDGTDIFKFDTAGNLLTLTGNYTVSGTGTTGNLATSANTIAAINDSGVLLRDNAGNGLTVADGGNVGIGDATPLAAFVVGSDTTITYAAGAGDAYIQRFLEVDGAAYLAQSTSGNIYTSANAIAATNDSGLTIYDNAANGITLEDGGNVGIGSTAPRGILNVKGGDVVIGDGTIDHASAADDLYVTGNLEVDGNVYIGDAVADTLTIVGALNLSGSTNYTGPITITTTHPNALLIEKANGTDVFNFDTDGNLLTLTGNYTVSGTGTVGNLATSANTIAATNDSGILLRDNAGNGLTVADGGNVGIGDTTPLAAFVVGSDAAITYAAGAGDAYIQRYLEVDGAAYLAQSTSGNIYTSANAIAATNDSGLTIYDNAANGITLLDGGSVGIGSVTPGSKLDVSGGNVRILSGTSAASVDHAAGAGSLYIQTNLEVDGNVYIGDAVADTLTIVGALNLSGSTNYTGPITITTTDANALLIEKSDGTHIFNFDTSGNLLTLTGNYTISGTGTIGNLATSGNTIAAINDSGILLRDNAGNGLTLADGGYVGIGTTVPAARLDIGGATVTRANSQSGLVVKGEIEVDNRIYVDQALYVGSGTVHWAGMNGTAGEALFADSIEVDGALYVDGFIYGNGSQLTGIIGLITGLTDNFIPRANGTTAIENSVMYDDGMNIGIGDATPQARLDVSGGTATFIDGVDDLLVKGDIEADGNVYLGTGTINFLNGAVGGSDLYVQDRVEVDGTIYSNFVSIGANPVYNFVDGTDDLYVKGTLEVDGGIYSAGLTLTVGPTVTVVSDDTTLAGDSSTSLVTEHATKIYVDTLVTASGLGDITAVGSMTAGDAFADVTASGQWLGLGPAAGRIEFDNQAINEVNIRDAYVGIGDATPVALLDVGGGTLNLANPQESLLVKGEIEVDNSLYVGTGVKTFIDGVNDLLVQDDIEADGSIYATEMLAVGDTHNMTFIDGNDDIYAKGDIEADGTVYASFISVGASPSYQHVDGVNDLYVKGDLEVDGNVYIGDAVADTLTVSGSLVLGGSTSYTGPVTITTTDPAALLIEKTDGTDIFRFDTAGNVLNLTGNYTVSGTGTVGNLATSANTIAAINDSGVLLRDNAGNGLTVADGGNIGIGNAAPAQKLEVDGSIYIPAAATGSNVGIGTVLPVVGLQLGAGTPSWTVAMVNQNDAYVAGDVEVDGALYIDGFIYGNGSRLTNLPAGGAAGSTTQVQYNNAGNIAGASGFVWDGTNVGIGATAPQARLDVSGGTATFIDGVDDLLVKGDIEADGNVYLGTGTINFLNGAVGGSDLYVQDRVEVDGTIYSNFVSIGASPSYQHVDGVDDLYIKGDLEVDGNVYIGDAVADTLTVSGSLVLGGSTSYTGPVTITTTDPAALLIEKFDGTDIFRFDTAGNVLNLTGNYAVSGTGTVGNLATSGNTIAAINDSGVLLRDNAGNGLTVADGGNIGIGNAAPAQKLEVDGSIYIPAAATGSNVGIGTVLPVVGLQLGAGTPSWTVAMVNQNDIYAAGDVEIDGALYVDGFIYGNGSRLTNLPAGGAAGSTTQVQYNNAGNIAGASGFVWDGTNVGIGATAPQARLDVSGGTATFIDGVDDLLVKGDIEADGNVYLGIGSINFLNGAVGGSDLYVQDRVEVDGTIYSNFVSIGASPSYQHVDGVDDLYIKGDLEVDGNVYIGDAVADTLTVSGSLVLGGSTSYTGPVTITTTDPAALLIEKFDGTDIFRFDTAGNVLNLTGNYTVSGTGTIGNLATSANTIAAINDSGVLLRDNAGNGLTLADGGYVGIGTTVPAALLDVGGATVTRANPQTGLVVKGEIEVDNRIYVDQALYVGSGTVHWAGMNGTAGEALFADSIEVDGALYVDGFIYGNGSKISGIIGLISGLTQNSLAKSNAAGTGLVDSAIYDVNGNVGINDSSPQAGLVVGSDTTLTYPSSSSSAYVQGNLEVDGLIYSGTGSINFLTGSGNMYVANRIEVDGGIYSAGLTLTAGPTVTVVSDDTTLAGNSSTSLVTEHATKKYVDNLVTASGLGDITAVGSMIAGDAFADVTASGQWLGLGPAAGRIEFDNQAINEVNIRDAYVGIGDATPVALLDVGGGTLNLANPQESLLVKGEIEVDNSLYVGTGVKTFIDGVNDLLVQDDIEADGSIYATEMLAVGDTHNMTFIDGNDDIYAKGDIEADGTVYASFISVGASPSYQHVDGVNDLYVKGDLEVDGNVYIGDAVADTLTVSGSLVLGGSTSYTGPVTITTTDPAALLIEKTDGTDIFRFDTAGNVLNLTGNYAVSGTGTVGNLATSGNTIAAINDSGVLLRDNAGNGLTVADGGNIGIGNAAPAQKLEVDGSIYIPAAATGSNVGIGTSLPVVGLAVGAGTPSWTVAMTAQNDEYVAGDVEIDGALYVDGFIYGNGSKLTGITGLMTGLTDNYIPRANGTTAIENSVMYDDGTNIGIGDATPQARLDVSGGTATFIDGVDDLLVKGDIEADGRVYGGVSVSSTLVLIPQATTLSVDAGTGVTPLANSMLRVVGNAPAVDLTANPQIATGIDGQELVIIGTSDTNSIKFNNGRGLSLQGGIPFTLGNGDALRLIYDGSAGLWREISRGDLR